MRLTPKSLSGRLTLAAAALTIVALTLAGGAIGFVLNRFVVHQLEQRLDSQLATVADALSRDEGGKLRLDRNVDGPPFDRPRSGWYWQAKSDGVELHSGSLDKDALELDPDGPPPPPEPRRRPSHPQSADGVGPEGAPLLVRTRRLEIAGKPVEIAVAAPWQAAAGPTRDALTPLFISLALLGAGLAAASIVQVRLGLRPLRALQASLADVRAGRATHVPTDQPSELKPLGDELNALIDGHAAGLASARLHVANLAHGLKTPLATIGVALAEPGRDPDGALAAELGRVEGRIRHHLARARAAALTGPARTRTRVKQRVDDLVLALRAIYADRVTNVDVEIDDAQAIACDPQDVDEMLGNLLDNAFKWTQGQIVVSAVPEGKMLILRIDDSGPGLPELSWPEALLPGRRLDEATPGDGFGLTISRELVELYGGSLVVARSELGGLRVVLAVPRAR